MTFVGAAELPPGAGRHRARKDQGTNLSADSPLAVLDDIDGQVRAGALGHRGGRRQRDDGGEADVVRGACRATPRWRSRGGRGRSSTTSASTCTAALSENGPWTRLTSSLDPRPRLVRGGPGVLVPRRRPHERHALLLPARGRGRVVEDDVSRPRLGGAAGRGSRAVRRGARLRGEPGGEEEGRVAPSCPDWVVAAYGSMAGASASAATLALHAPRRSRGGVAGCRLARLAPGDARAAGRAASTRCTRPRARCASSCPASTSRRTRRPRRCRSAARSWTRSSAGGSSSAGCGRSIR